MIQVRDLEIERDVLPCFNFTNNEQSSYQLLSLLQQVPKTEAEVLERQAVVQGMMANWNILEYFTYRRLDLREVHAHFEAIIHKEITVGENKFTAALRLRLSKTERNALRSKLVQIILLLSGLQRQYLGRLNKDKFPDSFKKQLQNALSFLNKLRLEWHAALINEDRFTAPKIVDFTQLLNQLSPAEIRAFWNFFFSFEAYWSIAKGTHTHGFSFPRFKSDTFSLTDFYHPIIKNPVKNSLTLDSNKNVLLLTGPNMSGKSTLLKAVGLNVYLAHVGFSVPAAGCVVPYFNTIAIAINLSDSLRDGYSHFMAEIENLKSVVRATEGSQRCFAIFDEIFRGTNIDDALDITKTTVNGLANIKSSYFLISTHMLQLEEQLNTSSSQSIKKCYIECVLEGGAPKFSYTLREGWSQLKIGRILFDKEGLTELLALTNKATACMEEARLTPQS